MTMLEDLDEYTDTDVHVISYSQSMVNLIYSKSAVYVHPTPRARDNIAGFLSLSRRPSPTSRDPTAAQLLLSWIPVSFLSDEIDQYTLIETDGSADIKVRAPPASNSEYAFSVAIADIANLIVKAPRTGWSWGSLVVVTTSGVNFPALFFHDDECISTINERKQRSTNFDPFGESGHDYWGWDSLLIVLRALTNVKKSETTQGVYTLNPTLPPSLPMSREGNTGLQWKILERFSRITRLGRSTADSILDSEAGQELLNRLPPQFRQMVVSRQAQTLAKEYDSARLYLARWAASISDASNFTPSSAADEIFEEESSLGMFEVLSLAENSRRDPVSEEDWKKCFGRDGELIRSPLEIRKLLFQGGCDEAIMGEVWCFLLGMYPWNSNASTRKAIAASKRDEYYSLKRKWFDTLDQPTAKFQEERHRIEKDIHRTDRQHPFFEHEDMPSPDPSAEWGTNAHMEQLKDILLTYNEFNTELGYVQGMSDLLAPVYVVSEDDAIAFWCFEGLMRRMERNFLRDQSGMRLQLTQLTELTHFMLPKLYAHLEKCEALNFFFFFRMLLIIFKREFSFATILQMWTVLFTDYYTRDFQLFIVLAILDLHSEIIIGHLKAFDEVLKYVNELSGRLKSDEVLKRAERLYLGFTARVRELNNRHAVRKDTESSITSPLSHNLQALIGRS